MSLYAEKWFEVISVWVFSGAFQRSQVVESREGPRWLLMRRTCSATWCLLQRHNDWDVWVLMRMARISWRNTSRRCRLAVQTRT